MENSQRLSVLDGLRAISILLVLAAHMLPLGPKVLRLNEAAGAMGMSLFFALSGFLITSTLLRNSDVLDFFVKRVSRIVPLAYAYILIVYSLLYFDPNAIFWTAAFLVNYFTQGMAGGLNNHFWSLCVEMHFYLAIALVALVAGRKGLWLVWPACLAVTMLRISEGAYTHIQTHLRVDEILAGACVATLYKAWWRGQSGRSDLLLLLAAAAWFASASPYAEWFQYARPYATAAVLIAALRLGSSAAEAVLTSSPMRYVATVSYALYVIHPLTIHGWLNQGGSLERYLLKRPLSFALTFALAHLSTFHWERWWQQTARQWLRRRGSALQPAP